MSCARIFPSLARALGWRVREADSGSSMRDSLANYDRATQSWKTSEPYLFEGLTPSLVRLPKSGMTRNGSLYVLQILARSTNVKGYGLWPTPVASDGTQHGKEKWAKNSRLKRIRLSRPPPTERITYAYFESGIPINHFPEMSEAMMGYPIGWTDLNASEIRLSLKSRN